MLASGMLPSSDLATVLGSSPGARQAGLWWRATLCPGWSPSPLFCFRADARPLLTSTLQTCPMQQHGHNSKDPGSFLSCSFHAALLCESVLAAALFEGTGGVYDAWLATQALLITALPLPAFAPRGQ